MIVASRENWIPKALSPIHSPVQRLDSLCLTTLVMQIRRKGHLFSTIRWSPHPTMRYFALEHLYHKFICGQLICHPETCFLGPPSHQKIRFSTYKHVVVRYMEVSKNCPNIAIGPLAIKWASYQVSKFKKIYWFPMAKCLNMGSMRFYMGTRLRIPS